MTDNRDWCNPLAGFIPGIKRAWRRVDHHWYEVVYDGEKRFCRFCGSRLVPDPSIPKHAEMYDEYTGERIKPQPVCMNASCNRGVTF